MWYLLGNPCDFWKFPEYSRSWVKMNHGKFQNVQRLSGWLRQELPGPDHGGQLSVVDQLVYTHTILLSATQNQLETRVVHNPALAKSPKDLNQLKPSQD